MRRWLLALGLAVLFGFGLQSLSRAAAAPADPPPFGAYAGTITIDQLVAAGLPSDAAAAVAGTWTITFNSDGTFSAFQNGTVQDTGSYTADASTIIFTDDDGPSSCQAQGSNATATYGYSWDGSTLTFTNVDDNCIGRTIVLQATGFAYTGS